MMKNLECIIFNVEHGFSAFIKSPNEYGLLIDCGSRSLFSPIKWIRSNYNLGKGNIKYFQKKRITQCIITHLHSDHFDDVGSFLVNKEDSPKRLSRDKDNIDIIDLKAKDAHDEKTKETLLGFKHFQSKFTDTPEDHIEWGFDYYESRHLNLLDATSISTSQDQMINNRSYITGIGFAGKKILFPGDIEVAGWKKALTYKTFQRIVSNTNIFVASHHGHKSGFTSDILDYSGIPDLYIISAKSGDEHLDSAYSKSAYAKGILLKGNKEKSLSVSTRVTNKSIKITIWEKGEVEIETIPTPDNLDENQKKIISRRTKELIAASSKH